MTSQVFDALDRAAAISTTLEPLPSSLRHGLTAVSIFAFLSFVTTFPLFLFLLLRMGLFSLVKRAPENQYVSLIFNLLFADVQQAIAFLLNLYWTTKNGIFINTGVCWAQGWFLSLGNVASSIWILVISLHTFGVVIFGYKPSFFVFWIGVGLIWTFIISLSVIAVALHPHDVYARAVSWCWLNPNYGPSGLYIWLHYLWIFICLIGTTIIYLAMFIILKVRLHTKYFSTEALTSDASRAMRCMIVFPTIFIICELPLAILRFTSISGRNVSHASFCVAGAVIASNGWLDVIIYSLTRRSIVFRKSPPPADCGLSTFRWDLVDEGTITTIEAAPHPRNRVGKRVSSKHSSMDDLFEMNHLRTGSAGSKTEVTVGIQTETTLDISTETVPGAVRRNSAIRRIMSRESLSENRSDRSEP